MIRQFSGPQIPPTAFRYTAHYIQACFCHKMSPEENFETCSKDNYRKREKVVNTEEDIPDFFHLNSFSIWTKERGNYRNNTYNEDNLSQELDFFSAAEN